MDNLTPRLVDPSGGAGVKKRGFRSQNSENWASEDYKVRGCYFLELFQQDHWGKFGLNPEVDAFARDGSTQVEGRWWGPGSTECVDAFQHSWSNVNLWMNPPYSRLKEVVEKKREMGLMGFWFAHGGSEINGIRPGATHKGEICL